MLSRFLPATVLILTLCLGAAVHAAVPKKTTSSKSSATKVSNTKATKKASARKATARKKARPRKRLSAKRLRRAKRAFVASADLKPMAIQLMQARTPAAYNGVERWTKKHAGTDAGGIGYLVLGYAYLQDRRFSDAITALKKAEPHAGELADYVDYFMGQAYAGNGDMESAIARLNGFETRYPDSLYAHDALIAGSNALLNANRAAESIPKLEARRTPVRADIELALGRAYLRSGQAQKGTDILRHLYYTMPLSPEADAADAELSKLGSLPPASVSDRIKRADLLYSARRYEASAREYRPLVDLTSGATQARVSANLAMSLLRSGDEREAREWFDHVPETAREAYAIKLFSRLEDARDDKDEDRVTAILNELRTAAPASSYLENGLMLAANMYLLQRDFDKAIDHYREISVRFPNGSRSAYAHWKAAWLDYRQRRDDVALAQFRLQVEKYPNSNEVSAAMYWTGRILEDKGDLALAKAWYAKLSDRYRNYYYGVLARERMRKIGVQNVSTDPLFEQISELPAPDPSLQDVEPPQDDLRYEKSRLLENAGLIDFAVRELQSVPGSTTGNWASLQIARVYADNGQTHRALQYLKRVVPSYFAQEIGQMPVNYWRVLFPRPWWSDVQRYSENNGLDPYLVASLIRQESEFNPGAVSRANAYGLMQLLPATGRKVAKAAGVRRYSSSSLLDPHANLQLGTRYFRDMIDEFGGQVEYALAAYNAGPHRVTDWRSNGEYRDIQEFVESIPFTETREYVQAIVRNAAIYKRLYGNPQHAPASLKTEARAVSDKQAGAE